MKTPEMIVRRAFCLCPWKAYDIWEEWAEERGLLDEAEGVIEAISIYGKDDDVPDWRWLYYLAKPVTEARLWLSHSWFQIASRVKGRKVP